MSKQTNIDTLRASLDGLQAFALDAANPDIVGPARDASIAKQAGVNHVANRDMHVKLG